jgi:hypothetical protein
MEARNMQTETQTPTTPEPTVAELTAPPPVPANGKADTKVVRIPAKAAQDATPRRGKVAQRGGKAIGAAAAKAKAEAEKGATKAVPKGKAKYGDTMKITVLAKKNPHREGSTAHQRFALFRTGMTVGAWRKAAIAKKLATDGHGRLRVYVNAGQVKVA